MLNLRQSVILWGNTETKHQTTHTHTKCINVSCAKASLGFHNVVCLIIDTDAQSTESAETWHLTEAEASRRANKGQNKGRSWVMIMQLIADPTHEYGSCGRDSRKGVHVRCMYILHLIVCTCFSVNSLSSYTYSFSLVSHIITVTLMLRHLCVSICI